MRKNLMNKMFIGGLLVTALTVSSFPTTLTNTVKAATETTVLSGTGVQADPYLVMIPDSEEYSFDVTGSGGARIYIKLICLGGGTAQIQSLDMMGLSNGTLYYNGNERMASKVTIPESGEFDFSVGGYSGTGSKITINFKTAGASAPSGTSNPSTPSTPGGEDALPSVSGSDLSGCTAPTKIEQTEREGWYTFTITKPSTLVFETENEGAYFAVFDSKDQYVLTDKNMPGYASSGLEMTRQYPSNIGACFKDLRDNNPSGDGSTAKVSIYDAGTYKIRLRNGATNTGIYGFKSFMIRDYKESSSLQFKYDGKTYKTGSTIKISESSVDSFVDVNIEKGSYGEGTSDGRPCSVKFSTSDMRVRESANYPLEQFYYKGGKFGTTKVTVYDERDKVMGSYSVSIVPLAVDAGCLSATGTHNSVMLDNTMTSSHAKKAKVYIKDGGKFKLKGTYANGYIKITGLKANKTYQVKVSNYDAASKSEGAQSSAVTVCTAPSTKPIIKSVKKIKKKSGQGHTTELSWPHTRHYYYYTNAIGTVKLKGKIKGASGLEVITTSDRSTAFNKASFSAVLLKTTSTTNRTPACKGTAKIKVRSFKKVGKCISYGPWSSVRKVKI